MNRPSSRSKKNFFWWILIFSVVCLLVGIISCASLSSIMFPKEIRAPVTFPDTEIVFVATNAVGFINADGSSLEYVNFIVKEYGNNSDFWRPVMGTDNHTLIVKVVPSEYFVFNPHTMTIWRSGALPVLCNQWGDQQMPLLSTDQKHIYIRSDQGMALYLLDDCGTENKPVKTYDNVFGIPSPDLQYLAYTNRPSAMPEDDRFIVIHDMDSGGEHTIGVGDYPTWSRDSQWLAFTGKDGIYIFNILRDVEPKRVILYKNPYPYHENDALYEGGDYSRIPPEVSWSADGKWLVYHKWIGTDHCIGIKPFCNAIYKVNIETGEEIKIINEGMYPYWRWPVESQK